MHPDLAPDLTRAESLGDLATLLETRVEILESLRRPSTRGEHYLQHKIPRRRSAGGRYRIVWECVSEQSQTFHKRLARALPAFFSTRNEFPSRIAHGYVPGRSRELYDSETR